MNTTNLVRTPHADIKIGDVVFIDNYEDGKYPHASPTLSGPFTKVIGNGCGRCFEVTEGSRKGCLLMHYPENMMTEKKGN